MSKLYLVHDFSPDNMALFAALSQYVPLLAEKGIELGPFNPLWNEMVPTHTFLWVPRPANRPVPPELGPMWAAIAEKLDAGKDVLLFTPRLEPRAHEYFWENLPLRIDMARHAAQPLIVVGRPALLWEQYFQYFPEAKDASRTQNYRAWLNALPATLAAIAERAGQAGVTWVINDTKSPTCTPRAPILKQVFSALGVTLPDGPITHPEATRFRSRQSRRIFDALEVQGNAWPELDTAAMRALLLALERDFPQDWLAPLDSRKDFARTAPVAELEALTGALPGSLATPEAFLTNPQADLSAPLSRDMLRAFRAALPVRQGRILQARLSNDEPMLNADEKALLEELSASGEFASLGDAVPPPELTVLTMTYNHENFIAECMDSVLAQKTAFPVRHLVLDHCSTDGTAAIVAEYARKYPSIRPVLLSRHRPDENVTGLFQRCRSKYAALCDGDDYFTEPTKLQKQVDMLEANPGLALCFHPVAAVFDDGSPPVIFPPLSNLPKRSSKEFYLADLMNGNFIQTNSVVYRWRFREGLPAWFRADLCPGDFYWHMLHAETGKIGFIPEIMSVYRRHATALYAKAFTSSKELRRDHGMAELEAYHAYNEHFGNRYFRSLSRLANGVFADFLQISLMENDDSLFNGAVEKYPEFARTFLHDLSRQSRETPARARTGGTQNGQA